MSHMKFAQMKCVPCEGKTAPLTKKEALGYLPQTPGWQLEETAKGIYREWTLKNFTAAVEFINRIKDVAEAQNHHPDIHLTGYRNLRIELSTHAIGGLSQNDFIVAVKINELPVELKK